MPKRPRANPDPPADAIPARLPPLGSPNVLFQSFRTGLALREVMLFALEGTDVSGDEYGVLGVIHFFPDHTPTQLATTLGIPATSISRYINTFVERGLVVRRPNPDDGRSYLLRVTPRGAALVKKIAPRVGELIEALRGAADRPLEELSAALVSLELAARQVLSDRALATNR